MGKGDKKTRRGKIVMGSSGVSRKKNKKKTHVSVISKPKEIKVVPLVEEKLPTVVEQPKVAEVEKIEKPKKETVKKEKIKEATAEKEPKAEKKAAPKKKE